MAFQLLFVIWRSRVTHPSYRRLIKSGKRLPKGAIFSDEITPYPYIRARDIKAGRIYVDELAFLTKEVQKRIAQYIVNTNDVVITIVGASVGDVGFVTPELNGFNLTENAVRLTGFSKCVNPRYLLYVLNSKKYWELMQQIAGGSAQPKLGIYKIESIPLELPSIEKQNSIVELLSTYDNLIENNQKQIKLLEEAAQRLYKEWFVDLRFPGHEDVQIVDGVPEGWKQSKVTELLEIKYGKDHKALEDGKIPVYGSGGVMRRVKQILYSGESVLIPRKGSLNNILYVDCDFWTIDTMFYSIPRMKDVAKYSYLYLITRDMYSFNIGAAVPSMTTKILDGMDILLPDETALAKFETAVSPLFEKKKLLEKQNEQLTEARDRLLPKLMSGEIEL